MSQIPESQQQYGSILTILGENAEQNGKLQNKQITFTHMAIGNANDEYVQPDRNQTALVNEIARIPVNSVDVFQPTPDSVPMLKVEAILPDDVNDLVIREFAAVAMFDGNSYFHAVGNCARIYVPKPINNGNVSTPVILEMIFVITSVEPIIEIDPNVVTASRDWVNKQIGDVKSDIDGDIKSINSSNTISPKTSESALNYFNGKKCTSVLGDSISHGAFSGNLFSNGWVRLLARSLNGEYGASSYGFTPYLSLGSGANLSKDLHSVSFNGNWQSLDSSSAENLVSGQGFRSSAVGDSITFTIPTFMRRCILHYVIKPGGGTFDVSVNGVVKKSIDTNGEANNFGSVEVAMDDNRYGSCKIKMSTTSNADVDFSGISYVSASLETTCHNYSQSGRRLRYVGEDVIKTVCENSHTVVMALGHNDHGETDPAYQSEVSSKIDLFIQYANQHKVRVVVPDFCWGADSSNWMRVLLKKLASDTGGIYVDLPSMLTKEDGSPADSNHLINTLGMWVDGSHPNIKGNKWVFETIAKSMKLSCTSKEMALALHDYAIPIQLDVSVDVENSLPTALSSVKRSSNSLIVIFYLEKSPGGEFPIGDYVIAQGWPAGTDITAIQNGTYPLVSIDGSTFIGGCSISASGQVVLKITSPTIYNDLIFQISMLRAS
ncbi:hypothetical protein VbVaMValp1_51 [Vibrio phage Vb_VaM_Valp1]